MASTVLRLPAEFLQAALYMYWFHFDLLIQLQIIYLLLFDKDTTIFAYASVILCSSRNV